MNPLLSAVTRYFRRSQLDRGRSRKSPRKPRRQRLCLEILEDRTVPSAISVADTSAIEGDTGVKFLDRFIAAGSGGLSRPRSLIFGPSADNDGVRDIYVADRVVNGVLRYDGATGAYIDTFIAAGSGGLNQPGDLVFGPDRNLYVSSQAGNQVLRYDRWGKFLGIVATGLSTPVGITFGPDRSLYIANSSTNEVLRVKNSVLSTFVSAGSGGLHRPYDVKFGPDGNLYVQSASGVLRYNGQTGAFINTFAGTVLGQGVGLWEQFGTDGYLYTTARTATTGGDVSLNRFNAFTGAYVDTLSIGRDSWNFMLDSHNVIYYSGNGGANYIERYGYSALAAFSVTLDAASTSSVTVHYATADETAHAGKDYIAASGTVTFASGQTHQTILVLTLDDRLPEPTQTFSINLSNPVGGVVTRSQAIGTIIEDADSSVVDSGARVLSNSTLSSGETAPPVRDASGTVYFSNTDGAQLRSESPGRQSSLAQLDGSSQTVSLLTSPSLQPTPVVGPVTPVGLLADDLAVVPDGLATEAQRHPDFRFGI
jgi:hypothetical protein